MSNYRPPHTPIDFFGADAKSVRRMSQENRASKRAYHEEKARNAASKR
ncbi:hypothetical protein HKCCSP123_16335 [Rhodobacterales bacterium HKCCSP123]|nr:hypothetical protein [Rhodobacterales bacterium HKCCSP123]